MEPKASPAHNLETGKVSTRRKTTIRFIASIALMSLAMTGPALAAEGDSQLDEWIAPLVGGKVKLDIRPRYEYANQDGKRKSNAGTVRTRLGYGTGEWKLGLSGYIEMENITTVDHGAYNDKKNSQTDRTVIADPRATEVNQAFVKLSRPELGGTSLIGGRQRIIFDDARFVGNVGWRQNEQTYDSALFTTALGVENLQVSYGYIWEVHNILGGKNDSESHLIRLSYDKYSFLKPTFFAYLLEFDDLPGNSADTVGLRLTGSVPLGNDDLDIAYQATYAYQEDADDNPVDYDVSYYMIDGKLTYKPLGAIGGGYEVLGSDNGKARFTTPFATGHKFNGWADKFLNNGGKAGLRDGYVYIAPKLPWGLKSKLVYHHFRSDDGTDHLGDEFDAVLSRKFGKYLNVLTKVAYYSSDDYKTTDIVRFWLQAGLKF